jgi:hypothetical protein
MLEADWDARDSDIVELVSRHLRTLDPAHALNCARHSMNLLFSQYGVDKNVQGIQMETKKVDLA